MGEKKAKHSNGDELRRRAEERIGEHRGTAHLIGTEEDQRGLHELQVHQVELEMQNDELRQSRDKLETSLERYSDLFDFAPIGYVTLDRQGTIQAVNFTAASLLGLERSRLPGRRFGLFITEEYRFVFAAFIDQVFSSKDNKACEVMLLNSGNVPLIVQIEARSDDAGQECRLALIDITERKQAVEALKRFNEELENRVALRTAELRDKDQILLLQSRQAAMGEMLGNIAHQWRQPLNILAIQVQQLLMLYDYGKFTRELLDSNVNDSMKLIQHMSRTIDDFRNYFKPDKGKIEFELSEVITNTLSLLEDSFRNEKIRIEFVKNVDPVITGYRNEFAQVILNILNNARDALIERGISDPRVTITIYTENDGTVVSIADNAGGIPEEIMGKIFDPYYTTKGPQTGTGVGLFMSKSIIEKSMSGRLTVRNTADGAEFRIEV